MEKFVTVLLAGLAASLLWVALVPLPLRAFGIRLPLRPFQHKELANALLALPLWQCALIEGVLFEGCVALILSAVVEWMYEKGPLTVPPKALFISAATCVCGILASDSEWHRARRLAVKQAGSIHPLPPASR